MCDTCVMNSLPRVIALCGKKRVGKDTIADYLHQKYGYQNVKFAEPLKAAVKALFGFSDEQIETNKEQIDPRWQITPRETLQFFGSEIMQYQIQKILPEIGREFFSRSLLAKYNKDSDRIVISDMRFLHEYSAIAGISNSLVIKIIKSDVDDGDKHISEVELEKIDPEDIIVNDGSFEELHIQIENILGKYKN